MNWRLLLLFAAPWFGAAAWTASRESKKKPKILVCGKQTGGKKKKRKHAGLLKGGGCWSGRLVPGGARPGSPRRGVIRWLRAHT